MSRSFQNRLANRLLRATALALALAPAAACGGSTTHEGDDDGVGGQGEGGDGQGGSANAGGQGGAGNVSNTGGTGGTTQVKSCFYSAEIEDIDGCPPYFEAGTLLEGNACGLPPYVVSGPTFEAGECCYIVEPAPSDSCGVGRPYVVDRSVLASGAVRAGGWSDRALQPRVDGLSAEARSALTDAWLRDALLEHASVASFGRFALELMAAGAPADLVEEAHRAALDEIKHAKMCFALASAYAGAEIAPAPFPFGGSAEVRSDLAEIAAAVVREGCIGETLAAGQAAAQLEQATDPAVRAVLDAIVEDESHHAELAWRTVAWAIRVGGDRVREAVRRAFDEAATDAVPAERPAAIAVAMATHGRIAGAELGAALESARRDVIAPCAAALLAA